MLPIAAQQLLFIAAVSFAVALLTTPVVARVAAAWGWVDRPDGRRKLHRLPVPTVGGVVVFVAFAVAAAHLEIVARKYVGVGVTFSHISAPLVVAAFVLMVFGLIDDLRGLRPVSKLLVQTVVAVYLYSAGFRIEVLSNPFGEPFRLGVLGLAVTVVWLVGMSNALNLIDGLDGLAAGLALVSTLGLLFSAALGGRWEVALVAAALGGALLGFLPYNFNPARIFLGDCGALPVGLILAAIAIRGSMKSSAAIAISAPLLVLALPILDVGLSVVRRLVRRRPVFQGDRDHIHHRLLALGFTPRAAAVALYGVACLFTLLALVMTMTPLHFIWAPLAVVLLVVVAFVRALGYWEVTEIQKTVRTRLSKTLRASGDAALHGLEIEVERASRFGDAWEHVCSVSWALGFSSLSLQPRPAFSSLCPALSCSAPAPDVHPAVRHGELVPATEATWTIEVAAFSTIVADVVGRRPLQITDFDPGRYARIVQGLLSRHVVDAAAAAWAPDEVPASAAPAADATSGEVAVRVPVPPGEPGAVA